MEGFVIALQGDGRFMKLNFSLTAAALLLSAAPAFAQAPPGGVPFGSGLQRGVMGINNSGQNGFVTLYEAGKSTRIVTALEGTLPGRVQTVAIQRGKSCDTIQPGIVVRSADMVKGISKATVPMTEDRLLSGNYVVVVYSNNTPGARPVACGQLYN
jgi:hypothetical protein